MSDPTTAETPTMRQLLAMTMRQQGWPDNESGEWCLPSAHDLVDQPLKPWLEAVDAILREMPLGLTREFLGQVRSRFVGGVHARTPSEEDISLIFKETLQHILNETKD